MKNGLIDWTLIEGRIGMKQTSNPKVSEVVAALEAVHPEMEDPFIIMEAPAGEDGVYPNYCQALAKNSGYICEIRTFQPDDFYHFRAFLPDAEGILGGRNNPQRPNLSQAIQILTGFIADPDKLPVATPVDWLDVSDEFEEVPA